MTEAFQAAFATHTPTGELNLIGAAQVYFGDNTDDCNKATKDTYVRDYNARIFPHVDTALAVTDYTDDVLRGLVDRLQSANQLSDTTIMTRMAHLVLDPIDAYFADIGRPEDNPTYGSSLRFELGGDGEDINTRLLRIRRSLTVAEELRVASQLLSNPCTDDGLLVGLAVMFLSASRNSEACGYNFGDLMALPHYPGEYVLRMYKSTSNNSNRLKAGGKTRNAPRLIVLPEVLSTFLLRRKAFVMSKVSFPFVGRDGTVIETIEDMPIVCRANQYGVRADNRDLSTAGRRLLRQCVGVSADDISGINYLIWRDAGTDEDLGERDATTYLLRRNMATHLYTLGLDMTQIQYYMGHNLEETSLTRADYADEDYLHEIARHLRHHPLNTYAPLPHEVLTEGGAIANDNDVDILLPGDGVTRVRIVGREWNDPVAVTLAAPNTCCIKALDSPDMTPLRREVNVTRAIHQVYSDQRAAQSGKQAIGADDNRA